MSLTPVTCARRTRRRRLQILLALSACAIVGACGDADKNDATSMSPVRAENAIQKQRESISDLQGWAQQATLGSAPTPHPTPDALAPRVVHTVE